MASGKKLIKPGAKRNKKLLTPAIHGNYHPPEITAEQRISMNPVEPGSIVTVDGDIWLNKTGLPGFSGWKNLSINEVAPAWSAWCNFSGLMNPPGDRIYDQFNVKNIEVLTAGPGFFRVNLENDIEPNSVVFALTTKNVAPPLAKASYPYVVTQSPIGINGVVLEVVATGTVPDGTAPFGYVVTIPDHVETDRVYMGVTGRPVSMMDRNLK